MSAPCSGPRARVWLTLAPLLLAACASAPLPQDGKIAKIEEEIDSSSNLSDSSQDALWDFGGFAFSSLGEDGFGAFLFVLAIPVFIASLPFVLPHSALSDDLGEKSAFVDYPYRNGYPGTLVLGDRDSPPSGKGWMLRASIDRSSDFDDIERTGFRFLLEGSRRLGLQGSVSHVEEDVGGGEDDDLTLADLNVVYRFAQCETIQFRAGLGANFLLDEGIDDIGFNFTYGADLYVARPLVFSGVFDWGTLGGTGTLHWRLTGGVQLGRFELFAGYDQRDIGGESLYGPVGGLRVQF